MHRGREPWTGFRTWQRTIRGLGVLELVITGDFLIVRCVSIPITAPLTIEKIFQVLALGVCAVVHHLIIVDAAKPPPPKPMRGPENAWEDTTTITAPPPKVEKGLKMSRLMRFATLNVRESGKDFLPSYFPAACDHLCGIGIPQSWGPSWSPSSSCLSSVVSASAAASKRGSG